jgi:hypothetical protein
MQTASASLMEHDTVTTHSSGCEDIGMKLGALPLEVTELWAGQDGVASSTQGSIVPQVEVFLANFPLLCELSQQMQVPMRTSGKILPQRNTYVPKPSQGNAYNNVCLTRAHSGLGSFIATTAVAIVHGTHRQASDCAERTLCTRTLLSQHTSAGQTTTWALRYPRDSSSVVCSFSARLVLAFMHQRHQPALCVAKGDSDWHAIESASIFLVEYFKSRPP